MVPPLQNHDYIPVASGQTSLIHGPLPFPSSLASVQLFTPVLIPPSLKGAAGLHPATHLPGSLGDQRPSPLSRFGRRGIVLLTLGLVGPCGVGGAAAGSSTGVMALRFLLGFLLAGVDLGVYLMREWQLPRCPSLGAHACLSAFPGCSHCPLGSPQSLFSPQFQLSRISAAFLPQPLKDPGTLLFSTPLPTSPPIFKAFLALDLLLSGNGALFKNEILTSCMSLNKS